MLNLVNEVASFSIHAAPLVQKYIAKLSFVLKIYLTIFSKFVLAMSEFTLMLVWTLSKLYEFLYPSLSKVASHEAIHVIWANKTLKWMGSTHDFWVTPRGDV